MRAEPIALGLDQVVGQTRRPYAVVPRERGAPARSGDPAPGGLADGSPPALLDAGDLARQGRIAQEVVHRRIPFQRLADGIEEPASDDAPAGPDPRDLAAGNVPAVVGGSG